MTATQTKAPAPPKDDLIRMVPGVEFRDVDGDEPAHLAGHFAVFNEWTEIHSWWEGDFLEQIAPGAFRKTFQENRAAMKVLFNHGFDPSLGMKPLGPIRDVHEDKVGAAYDVELIDTEYNRDFIIPAAREELLGASFRFQIVKEAFEEFPDEPGRLPERTILEARVFEFGPVTFPAYEATTAGIRSTQDFALWSRLSDDQRADYARFLRAAYGTTSKAGAGSSTPDLGAGPQVQGDTSDAPNGTPSLERLLLEQGQRRRKFE